MPRTTKTAAPLCQSCGKSTRHHSLKHCRPCAESVARFAEQFSVKLPWCAACDTDNIAVIDGECDKCGQPVTFTK